MPYYVYVGINLLQISAPNSIAKGKTVLMSKVQNLFPLPLCWSPGKLTQHGNRLLTPPTASSIEPCTSCCWSACSRVVALTGQFPAVLQWLRCQDAAPKQLLSPGLPPLSSHHHFLSCTFFTSWLFSHLATYCIRVPQFGDLCPHTPLSLLYHSLCNPLQPTIWLCKHCPHTLQTKPPFPSIS